jgi:hypothetical protein
MLPFLVPPMAAALGASARWPALRGAARGLGGVGGVVYAASIVGFPPFPEKLKNQLYEVTLRLLGAGLAAPNLGHALGLGGAWSLVPYALVVAAIWGAVLLGRRGPWRARVIAAGVALAVTATIVVAYGGFRGGGRVADEAYVRTVAPAVRSEMR